MRTSARLRVLIAAAVLVAVAGGCATPPTLVRVPRPSSEVTAAPYGPGAPGIGDSYFPRYGNGGYDVANYDLDLAYDPGRRELSGRATITATATANLTRFNLDFTGLDTTAIAVDGEPATWDQREAELRVTPSAPIAAGTVFTTVVDYEGQPRGYRDPGLAGVGFLTSAEGAIAIGQPEVAATWFPANDHPRDKATYTIRISAPASLSALSTGVLVSRTSADRPGYTTWTWRVTSPMAPYLATIVVGTYRLTESTHRGLPVLLAVHTSLPTRVDAQISRTAEVVDYLETVFGPYPFDALGGIVVNDPRVTFALENQTRPVYTADFFRSDDDSWILAHELAHQWFGDSVSIHDWRDIWLNEGFATYAQWLWEEHNGGATVEESFTGYYGGVGMHVWDTPPADPGEEHLFSGSVYVRGAMALHALRVTVGDEVFFRILREWPTRKKDGTATTAEFTAFAEDLARRDLSRLFQDWLYGTSRPPRP